MHRHIAFAKACKVDAQEYSIRHTNSFISAFLYYLPAHTKQKMHEHCLDSVKYVGAAVAVVHKYERRIALVAPGSTASVRAVRNMSKQQACEQTHKRRSGGGGGGRRDGGYGGGRRARGGRSKPRENSLNDGTADDKSDPKCGFCNRRNHVEAVCYWNCDRNGGSTITRML